MKLIKKGLDLPITGAPESKIDGEKQSKKVALVGPDYVGMRPTMLVKVGDKVKVGDPIFSCKKTDGVIYTAPASGTVSAINRGAKRVFLSAVIDVDGSDAKKFNVPSNWTAGSVKETMLESGLWTSLRKRPYSKVADPSEAPRSIFVTATDTNPLAFDPMLVISMYREEFDYGVKALSHLTEGNVFVCVNDETKFAELKDSKVKVEGFNGPHPAGNAGTHIHFLDPVSEDKVVWNIGYQDVIAVGKLFKEGTLWTDRFVSIAGPCAMYPRVVKTRLGADLNELLLEEVRGDSVRTISGSVLNGRKSEEALNYLGRYHNQVSLIEENTKREFLGWMMPGASKFSILNVFTSALCSKKKFDFSTTTYGSPRALVPSGNFERLMPLDILPAQLCFALLSGNTDKAQALGCLELDEEDLALLTFASSGKIDFGECLRKSLTIIEKEG